MSEAKTNKLGLKVLETAEEARLRTWMEMVRVFYRVQRRIVSTLAEQAITLPQFDVMATLRYGEGITQNELAEQLLVTKGNICGVLDRLGALGWVERRTDPTDARVNRVFLTADGRKKIEEVLPEHDRLIFQTLNGLTASDIADLRRLMGAVERGIEAA